MSSLHKTSNGVLPLIGLTCCTKQILGSDFHAVLDRYVAVVAGFLEAVPILIPVDASRPQLESLLARLDGVLVTGAPTMLDPSLYGERPDPDYKYDPQRDVTTQALIPLAIAMGVPVLAICRGIQDMNVAFGGSLHQAVHRMPGRLDHRAPSDVSTRAEKFVPSHTLRCVENTLFETLAIECGLDPLAVPVNSLHVQAIKDLGSGLTVEAVAPDGSIEAVRVTTTSIFAFGVQWHVEWEPDETNFNGAVLRTFQGACLTRTSRRSDVFACANRAVPTLR
ncbi:putative glutamine amidotransferase [Neorhizobium galegae]|uniref:gamma-glutamyl-gamma-aminobutyrate hydrolase family protein n=1 Tax=Neorhizobium galegae TaxID=399 RepID=UPI00277EF532|nr:gamma-glutamyl-gamma-aminobutyrate hydrolase family protein [Neorhizobium galegae]MDQ0134825.1 putative glutamine amidotransferase [Neorhizobium galegae]